MLYQVYDVYGSPPADINDCECDNRKRINTEEVLKKSKFRV